MRTTKELKDALMRLGQLPETPERKIQQEVIRFRQTEKTVFTNHVMKVPESERNESVFYAARDAAQFVAGKIGLDVLLGTDAPEADDMPEDDTEEVTVSRAYLEEMERRIERLELRLLKIEGIKSLVRDEQTERLSTAEACYYIGCSRDTLMRWTKEGQVKSEQQGRYYYYPASELMGSNVVRTFIRNKKTS